MEVSPHTPSQAANKLQALLLASICELWVLLSLFHITLTVLTLNHQRHSKWHLSACKQTSTFLKFWNSQQRPAGKIF